VPGVEVPPTSPKQFMHIASTGKFLYPVTFEMEDEKKTVYYLARYKSTRGEFGDYSVMFRLVIA